MAEEKNISRRKFIQTAGIALGVGVVACGGASLWGLSTPSSVAFTEMTSTLRKGKRVLIAYASKCGATAEIANFIGNRLYDQGYTVDVQRTRHVKNLAGYSAVMLGSAIYMGKLLGEAESFANNHLAGQSDIPMALFSVCLTMKENTPENIQTAMGYFDPITKLISPAAVGLFAGRIDFDTLPPLYRLFAQADKEGILAEGDFRDWDAISLWTDSLKANFLPALES